MNGKRLRRWATASAVILPGLVMGYTTAFAQATAPQAASPQAPGASPPQSTGLEEVIVTAQRRAENLQDVPIAVTNLTSAQIETQQITETIDIPRLVPNFFSSNITAIGSGNVYYLRGLGQTESFATFDPQVGQYVDDIYISRVSSANFQLFDVDNIQVLRGPQGTLFGRNSTGGAIVISLARPTAEAGGFIEAGYGSYGATFVRGSVNLPLNDEFFTKTAFVIDRDQGYVDDVATGKKANFHDDEGIRESFLWKPSAAPNVTWYATMEASSSKFSSNQNQVINGSRISYSGLGDPNAPTPVLNPGQVISDANGILHESFTNVPDVSPFEGWGAMSNIEVKFAGGTLNSITGFRGQMQNSAADFPFPSVSGQPDPYDENELGQFAIYLNSVDRQYSQEFKWTGNVGDRFNYTTGLFYLHEENRSVFLETLTVPIGPITAPSVFALELSSPENFHNETNSAAAYFQGDYKVTDAFTVTLGGRYTQERKNYDVVAEGPGGYDTAQVQAAGNATDLKVDEFTPRLVLQYKLSPDVMTFVSATKGFQGGGWNGLESNAADVQPFGPETVWSYEAGVRTESFDKKLVVNADVFYQDVEHYQLVSLGVASPGNAVPFVTENAANMYVYGLETDFAFRPIETLTFTGTFGLEQGGYYKPSALTAQQQQACLGGNAADCNQGIISPIGTLEPPALFPHATFALNGQYDWRFDRFSLMPNFGVQYSSGVFVGIPTASYAILDAGLKLKPRDSHWNLTAECKNCLMKNYVVTNLFIPWYNAPGTWDVKIHYDF